MKLSDAEKNLAAKSNELAQERDKNLILMKEMSDLRKQITDLLDENKQLKENEISQNEEFEVCEQELVEVKAEALKVPTLEAEIERLRNELTKDAPTEIADLRIQMNVHQDEISDMHESFNKQTGELQKTKRDLEKALEEIVRLHQQLDSDDGGWLFN